MFSSLPVKFQPLKQTPVSIASAVILLVSLLAVAQLDFFERLERMSYDWRVRIASNFPTAVATNFGFAQIDDETVDAVKSGELGYRYGLYWPRHVYGRLVNELAAQGARTIAFDVLFAELRQDHASVRLSGDSYIDSDDYFAVEMQRASNVVLAATAELSPPSLFSSAAAGIGDISTEKDADGVLRRARAFSWHRRWHPELLELESKGINLRRAYIENGELLIPVGNTDGDALSIPLDAENHFVINPPADQPEGVTRREKAFTYERVWHMGIVIAARELKLDLANPEIDLKRGYIRLRGESGIMRTIPVDRDGCFYVNWALRFDDPRVTSQPVHSLLRQNYFRLKGHEPEPVVNWKNKIAVIGSRVQGNDLTDRGATPLEKDTFLVSKHWNVANSVITGQFVRPATTGSTVAWIVGLGIATALLTWRLRVLPGLLSVIGLAVGYSLICVALFVQTRFWLPMVLPIVGALFIQYALLVTYRAVFEQRERRRVKSVFSKIVAPEVVNELLEAEKLALGGARREVTVMFADVRGFTELTDRVQEETTADIERRQLDATEAEARYEEMARETLQTVSTYLGLIADTVKKHNGTLDKYIGDCTMAFWGAPKANPQHAVLCVRAAIEAQRNIAKLNEERKQLNAQLEIENQARISAGLPTRPLLPILTLGTGINTGPAMVGLMGSDAHGLNYTVFGREVNLASRLETVSGRGRIIIGETTYQHLLRDDPALAATCIEQEPTKPKGFQRPVRNFEVPWQTRSA